MIHRIQLGHQYIDSNGKEITFSRAIYLEFEDPDNPTYQKSKIADVSMEGFHAIIP